MVFEGLFRRKDDDSQSQVSSSSFSKLKRSKRKVKIAISSDVYYEVNFNRNFWSDELKQKLNELQVKDEYDFEDQALVIMGKNSKNTSKAVDFIMVKLKETKDYLDEVSSSGTDLHKSDGPSGTALKPSAVVEEAAKKLSELKIESKESNKKPSTQKETIKKNKGSRNSVVSQNSGSSGSNSITTPEKSLKKSPPEAKILKPKLIPVSASEDDDDDKPLIVDENYKPVKTMLVPKYDRTLVAAVDKRTSNSNSVFFSNGKVVQSNPKLYQQQLLAQQNQMAVSQYPAQGYISTGNVISGPVSFEHPMSVPSVVSSFPPNENQGLTNLVMGDRYTNSVVAEMQKEAEERLKRNSMMGQQEKQQPQQNKSSKPTKPSRLRFFQKAEESTE